MNQNCRKILLPIRSVPQLVPRKGVRYLFPEHRKGCLHQQTPAPCLGQDLEWPGASSYIMWLWESELWSGRLKGSCLLGICLLLAAMTGCSSMGNLLPWRKIDSPVKSETKVKISGSGKMLSKGLNASLLPDEFISQVAELLTQDQKLAERHILRYPDLALQVLRGASIVQTENQAVREIARVYGKTIGSDAYLTLLDERVTRLENYSTYEEARKAFVGLTKQKQWLVAAGVDLPAALPANASPLLQLDAFHLTAEVQIKSGRPVAGKETLEKALSFASVNPHHQAYLLLMYSDVLRRNRQHEQANQIWNEAVQLAGELLKQEPGIADPTLWNRCAYHRPGNQAWPQSIQEQLGTFNKRRERIKNLDLMLRRDNLQMIASGESAVWTYVGHCHLERGEPESALLAFKRAEAWSNKLRVRDNLHLLQAEAFLQMDEKTPALAILSRLATKPAPDVSSAALALLGAIKLKEGNIDQSLAFLQKAVEKAPAIQWPGRAEAEANLGLAYLSVGKEEKGLRWLHSGQRRFENNQAKAQLRQSLHNEMIYLENAGKVQEAIAVQERLRSLKMNS